MAAALSEAASASDSIDGAVGAATYSAALSEAASASDAFSAAAVIAAGVVASVHGGLIVQPTTFRDHRPNAIDVDKSDAE
jgi:hypothetical protein